MASIILSTAGTAVGSATGLPLGSVIGARIGRMAGSLIDQQLFGDSKLKDREGPRLSDLAVQTSTYGKMIPIVYGTVRTAGNIIWARPIAEVPTTTTETVGGGGGGGKGGGGRVTQTTTTYSYYANLALAICEGEIGEVLRIWADAKLLDVSQYTLRVYTGSESQTPDSYIQSIEGASRTPAYRGLAYVVVENFPLAEFGNRVPNFTFEVKKKVQHPDFNGEIVEEMISGITLIPGGGEFVYDTLVEYKVPGLDVDGSWVQQGPQERINMHNAAGKSNMLLAVDQLEQTCPNIEWMSVVVGWFGESLVASVCRAMPGVEYTEGAITTPDLWEVAGYDRSTARPIQLEGGTPRYGGTPDDDSVLRCIDELRSRGYKVMFYPFLFMDIEGKPWRGHLSGSASDVANFFTKTEGYNAFIMHYANLVSGNVDAFVIGSELKGLTKVTDTPGVYPGVDALIDLASDVKAVLGEDVVVTYAADWSEYHHTDGGWYNLDPLWASPDIDVIGIDAYFPLTDEPQGGYDVQHLIDGWTSGEGYDFYYTDETRSVQAPLDPLYAWKNLAWFWENEHVNPDAATTPWVPESKKIWFTEYGYPSVDGATNQPNVFYDPATSGSAFPYFSKGRVDTRAQRAALAATEQQWKDSPMVEQKFIWAWDVRPFPYWPDLLSVWTDGAAWKTGHWVQGKLGVSHLAAIVADLCARAGFDAEDIDATAITEPVEGFVITHQQTVRQGIEQLQQGYFFDTVETDHILRFVPRGQEEAAVIQLDTLLPQSGRSAGKVLHMKRMQEIDLPKRVNVVYLSRLANYQPATQYAQRETTESLHTSTVDVPIVFSDQAAKVLADMHLYTNWVQRVSYQFELPVAHARLEPSDVISVVANGVTHRMRITDTRMAAPGKLRVMAVAEDVSAYDFYTPPGEVPGLTQDVEPISLTELELLDIPAFPGDGLQQIPLRIAGTGLGGRWNGAVVYRSDDNGTNYNRHADIASAAVIGTCVDALAAGPTAVFDDASVLTVSLIGDAALQSVSEIAVLNGANAALAGDEIIQFRQATLIEPGKYELSGLLRGRLGSERTMDSHVSGERFVLMNGQVQVSYIPPNLLNLSRLYKPVSIGNTLGGTTAEAFTHHGVALKPYAPVQVQATRDGSGNIAITWVRRTRISGEWNDYVEVPLNEAAELYEVDILDGGIVIRTISRLTTPEATYTDTQQIADFGGVQPSIDIRIYQLSSIVGRGYAAEATV